MGDPSRISVVKVPKYLILALFSSTSFSFALFNF